MNGLGLTVFMPEGDPHGIKIIEMSGWVGKAFIIPRAKLKDIKNRDESGLPGIYFLFGDSEDPTLPQVYIGESENFYQRLINHDGSKDFWTSAIAFVGTLDKADVKYLENKSVALAKSIQRFTVLNAIEPFENTLSEFKKSSVNNFFENIKFVLGVLGYPLFEEIVKHKNAEDVYFWKTDAAEARGTLLPTGEFIIYKGSTARIKETEAFGGSSADQYRWQMTHEPNPRLKNLDDKSYIFTDDVVFSSPSQASNVVAGRITNGWVCWKDEHGKTLDENKRK